MYNNISKYSIIIKTLKTEQRLSKLYYFKNENNKKN